MSANSIQALLQYLIPTAFHNPAAPKDAAPRESIESRMLVFYE